MLRQKGMEVACPKKGWKRHALRRDGSDMPDMTYAQACTADEMLRQRKECRLHSGD